MVENFRTSNLKYVYQDANYLDANIHLFNPDLIKLLHVFIIIINKV